MLSLIRKGPKGLSLKLNSHISEVKEKLSEWGSLVTFDPAAALSRYGPTRNLIFLEALSGNTSLNETYVSENQIELFLTTIINNRMAGDVSNATMLPSAIMMRLMGDFERGIASIQRDIGGEIIERDPIYRPDLPSTSTMIHFTEKPLTKNIRAEEMYEKALLIYSRSMESLVQFLSARDIEYLGDALGTPDWNDIEIKIYDADGFFNLQRQRFLTAVHGMQIGIVLEEKWEKELALMHRSVPVYMIKLLGRVLAVTGFQWVELQVL